MQRKTAYPGEMSAHSLPGKELGQRGMSQHEAETLPQAPGQEEFLCKTRHVNYKRCQQMKFQLKMARNSLRDKRENNMSLGVLSSSQNQGWSLPDVE